MLNAFHVIIYQSHNLSKMVEFFGHPVLDLEAPNTSTKLHTAAVQHTDINISRTIVATTDLHIYNLDAVPLIHVV